MRNEPDPRFGLDDVLIRPKRSVGPSRASIDSNKPVTPHESPEPRYVAAEDPQAGSDDINQMISEGSPTR